MKPVSERYLTTLVSTRSADINLAHPRIVGFHKPLQVPQALHRRRHLGVEVSLQIMIALFRHGRIVDFQALHQGPYNRGPLRRGFDKCQAFERRFYHVGRQLGVFLQGGFFCDNTRAQRSYIGFVKVNEDAKALGFQFLSHRAVEESRLDTSRFKRAAEHRLVADGEHLNPITLLVEA